MVAFWCPGCDEAHAVAVDGSRGWRWNGDADKPTITPSVLVRSGHYVPGHGGQCWCKHDAEHPDDPSGCTCGVCHSFVTDGEIRFLGDCTHALAGKTVPLPEFR